MRMIGRFILGFAILFSWRQAAAAADALWLEQMDLGKMSHGSVEHSVHALDQKPGKMLGKTYRHGAATHARSELFINLKYAARSFQAVVGVDDSATSRSAAVFQVWVDDKKVTETEPLRRGGAPRALRIGLDGARRIGLIVDFANSTGYDPDHLLWADARIELQPGAAAAPETMDASGEPPPEIASTDPLQLGIHGPRITGGTPGRPFLFRIPATGPGRLHFSARNLPAGITLDADTGILSGSLLTTGTTLVELETASVSEDQTKKTARRTLTIVAGKDKLALTPPMGWNSWNCFAWSIDDKKMRAMADIFTSSGLAAHGYQYLSIDDVWQKNRGADGKIVPADKFPDMKALGDYIHSKGLKFGIYSSPGPKTCAGFVGSYQYEEQDAKTFAEWGVDCLKYDYCYYSKIAKNYSRPELQKPYRVMKDALDRCGRDITYSICQYGMGKIWEWGPEVGGNYWRTTGDIIDTWGRMSSIGFRQNSLEKYAGPSHWNDPDMLVAGWVACTRPMHPTLLTPNEQVAHLTLWSLLASPLLIGCDLTQLDDFTLNLLTNDEVIAVDQDALGKAAGRRRVEGLTEVWARPLEDGSLAVGLFNRDIETQKVAARWEDLGLTSPQPVRDLWRKKELGMFSREFTAEVRGHGAVLVKIGQPAAGEK